MAKFGTCLFKRMDCTFWYSPMKRKAWLNIRKSDGYIIEIPVDYQEFIRGENDKSRDNEKGS